MMNSNSKKLYYYYYYVVYMDYITRSIPTIAERTCVHHSHAVEVKCVCCVLCAVSLFVVVSAPHLSLMLRLCDTNYCISVLIFDLPVLNTR